VNTQTTRFDAAISANMKEEDLGTTGRVKKCKETLVVERTR
jgi:hypothetical protein